jgi:hypothetical protein
MGITPEYIGGVDYLQRLSTLPYLHDLFLDVAEGEFFCPIPHDGFPSLEILSLQGMPLSLQSLLRALPSNRLKFVGIFDAVYNWTPIVSGAEELRTRLEEWCACFGALIHQAETLTELHIMLYSNTANPEDVRACALELPMMSIINPLLGLRTLQIVELEGFIKMPYSDADVRDVAAAWPKIKHIAFPRPFAEVMQPSLVSLRLLSRFCPNLENLSIGLEVKEGSNVALNSELLQQLNTLPIVTAHALTELDVYESDLKKEDVTELADQLRDLFPLLKRVIAARSQEVAAEISVMLLQENNSGPKTTAIKR